MDKMMVLWVEVCRVKFLGAAMCALPAPMYNSSVTLSSVTLLLPKEGQKLAIYIQNIKAEKKAEVTVKGSLFKNKAAKRWREGGALEK